MTQFVTNLRGVCKELASHCVKPGWNAGLTFLNMHQKKSIASCHHKLFLVYFLHIFGIGMKQAPGSEQTKRPENRSGSRSGNHPAQRLISTLGPFKKALQLSTSRCYSQSMSKLGLQVSRLLMVVVLKFWDVCHARLYHTQSPWPRARVKELQGQERPSTCPEVFGSWSQMQFSPTAFAPHRNSATPHTHRPKANIETSLCAMIDDRGAMGCVFTRCTAASTARGRSSSAKQVTGVQTIPREGTKLKNSMFDGQEKSCVFLHRLVFAKPGVLRTTIAVRQRRELAVGFVTRGVIQLIRSVHSESIV